MAGLLEGRLTLDELDLAHAVASAAEADSDAWREALRRGLLG